MRNLWPFFICWLAVVVVAVVVVVVNGVGVAETSGAMNGRIPKESLSIVEVNLRVMEEIRLTTWDV